MGQSLARQLPATLQANLGSLDEARAEIEQLRSDLEHLDAPATCTFGARAKERCLVGLVRTEMDMKAHWKSRRPEDGTGYLAAAELRPQGGVHGLELGLRLDTVSAISLYLPFPVDVQKQLNMADDVKQAEAHLRLREMTSPGCPLVPGTLIWARLDNSCSMEIYRFTAVPGQS